MGLNLTSAGDYAMRAMIYIACLPEGSVVLRSQISESEGIPSSFMAKILRRLVQARLLDSSRGVNGGFSLARSPSEISMLDIVEAIEGPLNLTLCSSEAEGCSRSRDCPASLVWPLVQDSLRSTLGGVSLESLASAPRRNGRVSCVDGSSGDGEPKGSGKPASKARQLHASV
jgi:Rrf2 family protein